VTDDIDIRVERPKDHGAVRRVVGAAFGTHDIVPDLVDMLRQSTAWRPELSLVAEKDGAVVGHVLATRGWIDAPASLVEVLVLSPLSVDPPLQRRGIGAALVRHLLDVARDREEPAIFLEGSPDYYSRFGFEPAVPLGFQPPSPRIPEAGFQAVRLPRHSPEHTGALVYPDPFWACDCVGLR
jgi:putative acetyltransferase